jgi:hypothetical protein
VATHRLIISSELCILIGVTSGWVYRRTRKDTIDALLVIRLGVRGIRFNPGQISTYLRSLERHRLGATFDLPDGRA